jgi:hypothetical protein
MMRAVLFITAWLVGVALLVLVALNVLSAIYR